MSGLNDNFFLADDSLEPKESVATIQAFKEEPVTDDVPELRDDLDLIAVATEELHIKLRDLDLLQEMIREQGGMSRNIAMEAHAIMPEFLNDDRPIEFFTKMPSRTQLSAALEDIDNEKKSLIKRMIERIIEFVKKLAKRIKDYLIVDPEKAKADAEFSKNYKGPTDEQVRQATASSGTDNNEPAFKPSNTTLKFLKEYEESDDKDPSELRTLLIVESDYDNLSKQYLLNNAKFIDSKIKNLFEPFSEKAFARGIVEDKSKWDDKYYGEQKVYLDTNFSFKRFKHLLDVREYLAKKNSSGGAVSDEDRKVWVDNKMALITAMLGKDRIAFVNAMLDSSFARVYLKALEDCDHWVNAGVTFDEDVLVKRSQEMTSVVNNLSTIVAAHSTDSESEQRKVLSGWVTGRDHQAIARVNSYFAHPATDEVLKDTQRYLAGTEKMIQDVSKSTDPNAPKTLQVFQKELAALASFIGIMVKIDNCYHTVIKGLRK